MGVRTRRVTLDDSRYNQLWSASTKRSAPCIEPTEEVLEAIGPDEQEAINELEALLLRFRDDQTIPVTECSWSL